MTLTLDDLDGCFEGVIPSIIATVSEEGIPNISYLSDVVQVDARHVALSNQFFGKTGANLRAVPRATILLVDGRGGAQYRLETLFIRSETSGEVFDRMAMHLTASSAQVGMADVMRLKAVDVFHVTAISQVPAEAHWQRQAPEPRRIDLHAAPRIGAAVSDAMELGEIVDAVLDGVMREIGCHAASVLL
ncbi:MAG: pyridoxamine 5'-phosphate oxidase family protein, partial [bacterium]